MTLISRGASWRYSASSEAPTPGGAADGKRAEADYVYVMEFDGDKIRHMTKIWNDGITLRRLGWA